MSTKRFVGFTLVFSLLLAFIIAQKSAAAKPHPQTAAAAWQTLPGPTGGSLTDVVLSPVDDQGHTVFAGVHGRGVYRIVNDALAWTAIGSGDWDVVDLAISPDYAVDDTLFALTGLWTTGFTVQRSTNGGDSWQPQTAPASFAAGLSLAVSPNYANDQTLYLNTGADNLTYLSTDGGATFAPAVGWLGSHNVSALAFSPAYATDQTLFALVPLDGLYRSTDGGATWQPGGFSANLSALAVSPNFANDQMLIIVGVSGDVHISTDAGATWDILTGPTLSASSDYTIAFSPTFASDQAVMVASAADPGPYRSLNGGASWESAGWYDPGMAFQNGLLGGGVQALALAPNQGWDGVVFAATRAGMAHSPHGGDGWYQRNEGLPRLAVNDFALSPDNPQVMLAGTGYFENLRFDSGALADDGGSIQISTNGGYHWRQVSGRLARVNSVAFSPNFASDGTAFAAAGFIGQHGFVEGGLYRSNDGGEHWTAVHSVPYAYYAIAVSPNYANDQTVWATALTQDLAVGVYRSSNGGDTWLLVADGRNAPHLAVSPNYALDQTLFAGMADDGVHRSTNGGVSWNRVLPTPYVTALTVSPVYGASRTVYAAARPNTTAATVVYRSADGGTTWQELATGIPAAQDGRPLTISSLAFAVDGSVVAGASYGVEGETAVYRSADGGQSWQLVDGSIPGQSITDLATLALGSFRVYAAGDDGLHQTTIDQGGMAEPGFWHSSGPRGGKANALAVSPNFASDGVALSGEWFTTYQISEFGSGIVKSTDFGQTWNVSAAGTEAFDYASAVHDAAFSPEFATDQTAFAATGGGLFRSTDGGATWTVLDDLVGAFLDIVYEVAVAPDFGSSGQVLAVGGGLSVSQDGGDTWTMVAQNVTQPTYSPNFAVDGTVFGGGSAIYKSDDRGLTWTGVLSTGVTAVAVSPNFAADQTVWGGGQAIHISNDAGATWITRTIATGVDYVWALAVSPQFAADQTLFAGTDDGLYWSEDGGLNWTTVAEYAGQSILRLAISPQWPSHTVLLVGTQQGVYRLLTTDPASGVVKQPAQGLIVLETTKIALSADESVMLAGTVDHGVYASANRGQSWQPTGMQAGGTFYHITALAISPDVANNQTLFAVSDSTYSIGAGLYRSVDGGATWQFLYSSEYISSLVLSPEFAGDQTVYSIINNGRLQRSTNGGDTWSPLPNWPPDVDSRAIQLALPPNYPADGRLFVGSSSGFWTTPDDGATWTKALTGLNGNQYVSELAVSPDFAADQTLLAAASWSDPPSYIPHFAVFRSTDGGVNWQPVMAGLPEAEFSSVAFSRSFAVAQTAYVTTGANLYRSRDGGVSWTLVGAPPGAPQLMDVLTDNSGSVHVATSAGVWRYHTLAYDIIINGGFEGEGGWTLPITPVTAEYTEQVVYDGFRAMRLGLDNEPNVYGYSSARQVVDIPAEASAAELSFYFYPVSGEATAMAQSALFPENRFPPTDEPVHPASSDAQYVLLLDPATQNILETLLWDVDNSQAWLAHQVDLSAYAGQSLVLLFGAFNDGVDGRTALYVDNVSLVVYDTSSAPHRLWLPVVVRSP